MCLNRKRRSPPGSIVICSSLASCRLMSSISARMSLVWSSVGMPARYRASEPWKAGQGPVALPPSSGNDPALMILASNDDGIQSSGLARLVEALRDVDDVIVVAPDRERSAVSHALT